MARSLLLEKAASQLTRTERVQIAAIRRTFEPGLLDRALRLLQHQIGSRWITIATSRLRNVHHLDRWPTLDPRESYVCVCNHRSFFDLYVVTGHLVRAGTLRHRIAFPVRSAFFYDQPLGFFVNGVMSFFAMYPPIFRERRRAALNLLALDELAALLREGGVFAGMHPEGQRNKGTDPYALLPAQSGVGRVIHAAQCAVLPVFINGPLQEDLPRQVASNFDGTGIPMHIVFGAPVEMADLFDQKPSPRVFKQIANRALRAVALLGNEEREIRARFPMRTSRSAVP